LVPSDWGSDVMLSELFAKKIEASPDHTQEVAESIYRVRDVKTHCGRLSKALAQQVAKLKDSAASASTFSNALAPGRGAALLIHDSSLAYKALVDASAEQGLRMEKTVEDLERLLKVVQEMEKQDIVLLEQDIDASNKRAHKVMQMRKKNEAGWTAEHQEFEKDCAQLMEYETKLRRRYNHLVHRISDAWIRVMGDGLMECGQLVSKNIEFYPPVPDTATDVPTTFQLSNAPSARDSGVGEEPSRRSLTRQSSSGVAARTSSGAVERSSSGAVERKNPFMGLFKDRSSSSEK